MDIKSIVRELLSNSTDVIGVEYIEKLITNYYKSGKNYTIKLGIDPTAPDLHLGHTVLFKKLSEFQKHGAIVQLIIGDYTALIGDPTGKSKTRKVLSSDDIIKNFSNYQEQLYRVIDKSKIDLYYNSKWLKALGSEGIIKLSSNFNVARMLERDDFKKRYKDGSSISISEFLYPLLQGYDSVHLKSDIEIGGNDQKFNLHVGRILQKTYDIKEQSILLLPILEGLDGTEKMSKSLDNYIALNDNAKDMFAKIMSINDTLMWKYYNLVSRYSNDDIKKMYEDVIAEKLHPKLAKEKLAIDIISIYHNKDEALLSRDYFNNIHSKNEVPEDIKNFDYSLKDCIMLPTLLVNCGLISSTSQARRDITAGAVRIDGKKVLDYDLSFTVGDEHVLQVGKRKFIKLKVTK